MLAAQERLPEQEQPQMGEQQAARPDVGDAAHRGHVQQREHRHDHEAPVALAEPGHGARQSRERQQGHGLWRKLCGFPTPL